MPIVRARDVRANIRELGFEQGIVQTLELFLDEYAQTRQHMREMVELQSQMIDQLNVLHSVGKSITQKMDQMHRDLEQSHGNEEC